MALCKNSIAVDENINQQEWDEFCLDAINGTLFHTLKFLSYHKAGKFNHLNVTFRRKGNLAGIFPGALITEEDKSISWVSHPGASYGGPAWSYKLSYSHLESLIGALVDYARKKGFARIKMTPPPVCYHDIPEESLRFALIRNGFSVSRVELTQAVKLNVPEESILATFCNKTRNSIRRAVKSGLEFRIISKPTEEEFDRFWEILVENRAGLGVVPAHSLEEIKLLHRLVPENLMMAVVEHKGRIITTIWNFVCNHSTVLEFYMAHQEPWQKLKPVPFMTYNTLLWAKSKGFKYFDFGISSIMSNPTWGLLKFKENFRANHFLRSTFECYIQ